MAYVMWVCTDPCTLAVRGYAIHPHLEAVFAASSLSGALTTPGVVRAHSA